MRVLTEEGAKTRKQDLKAGRSTCDSDCSICYEDDNEFAGLALYDPDDDDDMPDSQSEFFDLRLYEIESEFAQGYKLGKQAGLKESENFRVGYLEIQRLTLENSLLKGELSIIKHHTEISKEE